MCAAVDLRAARGAQGMILLLCALIFACFAAEIAIARPDPLGVLKVRDPNTFDNVRCPL